MSSPVTESLFARLEPLLAQVNKPIQYVGGELNSTIKDWDDRQLVDEVELSLGRDLQFIRLNGTVVGSVVGLLIYTVAQLL